MLRHNVQAVAETAATVCAAQAGISVEDLLGQRRHRHFAYPRQRAMCLTAELTDASYGCIGMAFKRDRTTVMHAVEAERERLVRGAEPAYEAAKGTILTQLECGVAELDELDGAIALKVKDLAATSAVFLHSHLMALAEIDPPAAMLAVREVRALGDRFRTQRVIKEQGK